MRIFCSCRLCVLPMKFDLKKLPKSELEMNVEVSVSEVEKCYEKAARNLSADLKIPGFRPGHVPAKVVLRQVGEERFWQEAATSALSQTYVKIIFDHKIEAIGRPQIQIIKIAPKNPFVYRARVFVLPEISLPDYRKIRVKKREVRTDPKEVARLLSNLQKSRAKFKTADRGAKMGDGVEVDMKTYLDKVPIDHGENKNYPLILGEGKFVPGFEDKLIGMKAGEKKEFVLRFPKNYHKKNLSDRDVEFVVEMKKVKERELPNLDDNFARSLGRFKDLADLKEGLAKNLKSEAEQKENDRFQLEAVEKILEKTKFEAPEILVESETEKMIKDLERMVKASGGEFEKYLLGIKKTVEDLKKDFQKQAEKRVKTGLILREVAKREKISVSAEEVEREQKREMGHWQHDPETIKKIESEEYRDYLFGLIQNRKVFEFLERVMGVR